MKIITTIILFSVSLCSVLSQEMQGLVHSNYAGVYGIGINPSGMQASRLYMDFNLATAQSSLENNYVFWKRDDFLNFLATRELPTYYTSANEKRNFNIYRDHDKKFGYQDLKILGPSGMVVYGKHAFGVTTALRSISSFKDLPHDIALYLFEAIDYRALHNIDFFHMNRIAVNSVSWFELGLSYAYNFNRNRWNYWAAGISVKPLFGVTAAFFNVDKLDYQVHYDDSASVYDVSFRYGYALPVNYSNNIYDPSPMIKGYGFSTDLGFTFRKTAKGSSNVYFSRLCEQEYEKYNYRIGLSILDLGFIKFNRHSQTVSYNEAATEWYKPYDTVPSKNLSGLNRKIAFFFDNEKSQPDIKDNFVIYLPTVVSLQADVPMKGFWFLNGTIMQNLGFSKSSIYRPPILAITPRYETPHLEVSIPVSIYNYVFSDPHIGFFIRYQNIFIGSDKLNTLLGFNDFTGYNIYAGFRMNLSNLFKMNFIKGFCGGRNFYNIETFDYRNF